MEQSRTVLGRGAVVVNGDLDSLARLDLESELRIDRLLAERPGALTYLADEIDRKRRVVVRVRDRKALEAAGLLDSLEQCLADVAALGHQSIVPIYGFGLGEHTVWWTNQFVQAPSLADLVRSEGRLPLERTIRIATRVAEALLHAHDRGVAHGDVSPANLLIRTADWVVVKDFVRPEAWLPNVARGETAKRSPDGDQRALAITIYRCLIGDVDRPAAGLLTELASAGTLAARRPDLAPWVVAALVRGADWDSSRQFGSVVELVAALHPPRVPNPGQRTTATPGNQLPADEPLPEIGKDPDRRRVWIAAVTVVTLVVAALGLIRWIASPSHDPAPTELAVRDTTVAQAPVPRPIAPAPVPTSFDTAPARVDSPPPAATLPAAPESTVTPSSVPTPDPPATAIAAAVESPSPAPPAGSARLSVSSQPGGTLYIDNRLIGRTPRIRVPISPGRHVIKITRPGYRTFLSMIEVAAGEDHRLTNLVLRRDR